MRWNTKIKMADVDNYSDESKLLWTVDMEVNLFHAMRGHKPVGINRFFHMMSIVEKMNSCDSKQISSAQIWKHLMTLYDLNALNESEAIPFQNTESEFALPPEDFASIMYEEYPRTSLLTEPQTTQGTFTDSTPASSKPTLSNTPTNTISPLVGESSKRKRTRQTLNTPNTTPDQPSIKRRR